MSDNQPQPESQSTQFELFYDTLKIALYGKFGSRKTQQIAELIKLVGVDNVLVISIERGVRTIRSKLTKPSMVIPVADHEGLRAAYAKAKEFATTDRWVVIDGGSQMHEMIENLHMGNAEKYYDMMKRNQTIPNDLLPYGRYMMKGELHSPGVYGRIGRDSEILLSAWVALPVNLYVNYLEEFVGKSGFDRTFPYGPSVAGNVGLTAIMSTFDFVGRLSYGTEGQLVGSFDPASNVYMARTRDDWDLQKIPKEMSPFSLAEFVTIANAGAPVTESAKEAKVK